MHGALTVSRQTVRDSASIKAAAGPRLNAYRYSFSFQILDLDIFLVNSCSLDSSCPCQSICIFPQAHRNMESNSQVHLDLFIGTMPKEGLVVEPVNTMSPVCQLRRQIAHHDLWWFSIQTLTLRRWLVCDAPSARGAGRRFGLSLARTVTSVVARARWCKVTLRSSWQRIMLKEEGYHIET